MVRNTNKLRVYLLLALSFVCFNVSAQNTEGQKTEGNMSVNEQHDSKLEAESRRKIEWEGKVSALESQLVRTEGKLAELRGTQQNHNKKIKDLNTTVKKKQDLLGTVGIQQLKDQCDSLSKIQQSEYEEKRIVDDSVQAVDGRIAILEAKVARIQEISNENADRLIAKYQPELEKQFTAISRSRLAEIRKECNNYVDNKRVEDFISYINEVEQLKLTYDNAVKLLDTKYDAKRIAESITNIKSKYDKASAEQKAEFDEVVAKLEMFDDGMEELHKYITYINGKRNRNDDYRRQDFIDDSGIYLDDKPGCMKKQPDIDKYIMPIPYLKKSYEQFNNALKANGNAHPQIENEILNYKAATN